MRSIIPVHNIEALTAQQLCQSIADFLDARKALDIVEINLEGKSSIADYMVIASGTSQKHLQVMGELLKEHLHALGVRPVFVEGGSTSDWVLLDAGAVIVHLFRPEVRALYNFEKMWGGDRNQFLYKA